MGFFHNQYMISSVRRFWSITIGSTLRTGWWRSRSAWMNKSCPALRKLLYSKSFKQFMCKKKSHQILNKRVNRNRIFIYLITIRCLFLLCFITDNTLRIYRAVLWLIPSMVTLTFLGCIKRRTKSKSMSFCNYDLF